MTTYHWWYTECQSEGESVWILADYIGSLRSKNHDHMTTPHYRRTGLSIADDDHEQIVIRQDPETGLRFIVAVHSTVLGPALGGMRLQALPRRPRARRSRT